MRMMRRKDRQITDEAAKVILEKAEFGTLSMLGKDNKPYGIPINFAYKDNVIYLHGAVKGKKLDNMAAHPEVCFSAVSEHEVVPEEFSSRFKSCIVFGKMTLAENDEEKRRGLLALVDKYSPDFYEKGLKEIDKYWNALKVMKIEIESINGKHHK